MTGSVVYLLRVTAILGFLFVVYFAFTAAPAFDIHGKVALIAGAWIGGLLLLGLAEAVQLLYVSLEWLASLSSRKEAEVGDKAGV